MVRKPFLRHNIYKFNVYLERYYKTFQSPLNIIDLVNCWAPLSQFPFPIQISCWWRKSLMSIYLSAIFSDNCVECRSPVGSWVSKSCSAKPLNTLILSNSISITLIFILERKFLQDARTASSKQNFWRRSPQQTKLQSHHRTDKWGLHYLLR